MLVPRQLQRVVLRRLEFPERAVGVTCTTFGSNGDADLLVQWNDPPVRSGSGSFDCLGNSADSNERCYVNVPSFGASTLYTLVYAYEAFAKL